MLCRDLNETDTRDQEERLESEILDFPIHGQKTLVLILTNMADQYPPPQLVPSIGRSHTNQFYSPLPP